MSLTTIIVLFRTESVEFSVGSHSVESVSSSVFGAGAGGVALVEAACERASYDGVMPTASTS